MKKPRSRGPDLLNRPMISGHRFVFIRQGHFLITEQKLFHLLLQKLARLGIQTGQTIFIDQDGLMLQPLLPRLLGDVFIDLLSQRPGKGGMVQPFQFLFQLDALYLSTHVQPPSECV